MASNIINNRLLTTQNFIMLKMKTKRAIAGNTVLIHRHFCRSRVNNCKQNDIYDKRDEKDVKKDLKNFLSKDSPLKNMDDQNSEWATTPYPEGTEKPKKSFEKIDPSATCIIMFPGQGSQYVGMGKNLHDLPNVKAMFESASSILGYDLKDLCLKGPKYKLDKTVYCQPATLVCSLAAVELLKLHYPHVLNSCVATCGFSLGEIASLVLAGCITFENAVHITKVRALAMQACSEAVPSGMMTVLYGSDSNLSLAMEEAKAKCHQEGIENPVCQVANYLIPECKVLAGHNVALKYIAENKEKYKIRKTSRLPVSGAFHTTLMKDAKYPVVRALSKIEIKTPLVNVFSNVDGKPYPSAGNIRSVLPRQIYKPVKWEQLIHYIYERPRGTAFPHTYILGPGKSLQTIISRVNALAAKNCHVISA